jgi:hypothetical protein
MYGIALIQGGQRIISNLVIIIFNKNSRLWQRLESRLIEMRERRKRLLKSLTKKDTRLFEEDYSKEDEQKNVIIQGKPDFLNSI